MKKIQSGHLVRSFLG